MVGFPRKLISKTLHGIFEEYINRVWWYILIKSCIYWFLFGIDIYSCVRFRKHSRLLFHLMIWYLARSISPITPGLIHRSFLETKLHICLKLRSAISFCFSMHAHGSCPEHRTIPALPLLEKNCRFETSILLMFITNVLNVDHCENASFYVGSLLFNPTSDERFLKGSQYTILPLYMSLKYRRLNMGIFIH